MNQKPSLTVLLIGAAFRVVAANDTDQSLLPPVPDWKGASEQLVVAPDHPWITPSERSGLTRTPRYAETMVWLRRLVETSPQLQLTSIGKSDEGRDIWMVIASREGDVEVDAIKANGRPTLLAHSGIHSGEIDGKDAGLMLLRDMTVIGSRAALLDQVNLLFIPILSVDAHERFSTHNRVNQRGPEEMGWRTNRRNLNLNRDFAKLDTREVRALVGVVNRWRPDLYVDLHVTDGQDYQYDITYGYNGPHGWSPAVANWLDQFFTPAVDRELSSQGHIPGPLIFAVNGRDLQAGFIEWTAGPRYSTGWGDARHLPSVLVENHSLKPYRQRVLGTYVLLAAAMEVLGARYQELRQAVMADQQPGDDVSLAWQVNPEKDPAVIDFLAIRSEIYLSPISGSPTVRWTGEKISQRTPVLVMDQAVARVRRASHYYLPAAWHDLARVLEEQGILSERLTAAQTVTVERYRLPDAKLDADASPFEGRARYSVGTIQSERVEITLPAGSVRISTNQPLGTLVALMLEPESPDSLFQWGFMGSILQRTEYIESYVVEPMAQRMLAANPELNIAFQIKLQDDPAFAADPRARLQWFYEQTPFYDEEYRLYPVLRSID